MSWYSFKFKPKNTIKNRFLQVSAKDKREAKRKILKSLAYVNRRYVEVYKLEKKQ
jgi:hypothetical protein